MKKGVFISAIILSLILLCGCINNTAEPKKDEEQMGTGKIISHVSEITQDSITIIFKNNSNYEVQYGPEFFIDKNENGRWLSVPQTEPNSIPAGDTYVPSYVFYGAICVIPPGLSSTETFLYAEVYGELSPGSYRLVNHMTIGSDEKVLYTEFEIK